MSQVTITLYHLKYTPKLAMFAETHCNTLASLCQKSSSVDCITQQTTILCDYMKTFQRAIDMALQADWEGDYSLESNDILVFTIPDLQGFRYGFVFQDRQRDKSIVVSPIALDYMQEHSCFAETTFLDINASTPQLDIKSLFE